MLALQPALAPLEVATLVWDRWAEFALPRVRGLSGRFMSANNRSLVRSAQISLDVESGLAAIRVLHRGSRAA